MQNVLLLRCSGHPSVCLVCCVVAVLTNLLSKISILTLFPASMVILARMKLRSIFLVVGFFFSSSVAFSPVFEFSVDSISMRIKIVGVL